MANEARFSTILNQLESREVPSSSEMTTRSLSGASNLIRRVRELRVLAQDLAPPSEESGETWSDWLIRFASLASITVSPELLNLLQGASRRNPLREGLAKYLASLDNAARDMALEVPAVSIMSMSRSKGLTRDVSVIVGVERGIIPRVDGDQEEERRLLYVAMTRARSHLFLTMAANRTGPTAYSGGATSTAARVRSHFFEWASLQPEDGAAYLRTLDWQ